MLHIRLLCANEYYLRTYLLTYCVRLVLINLLVFHLIHHLHCHHPLLLYSFILSCMYNTSFLKLFPAIDSHANLSSYISYARVFLCRVVNCQRNWSV